MLALLGRIGLLVALLLALAVAPPAFGARISSGLAGYADRKLTRKETCQYTDLGEREGRELHLAEGSIQAGGASELGVRSEAAGSGDLADELGGGQRSATGL